MKYIRLPLKHRRSIDELSDPEAGRLIKALMHYAESGEVDQMPGKESGAFCFLRDLVDEDKAKSVKNAATYRANGAKGGRPKNQSGYEKTKAVFEKPKRLHNIIEEDDDIARVQEDHQALLAAAEKAGFPTTGAVAEALIDLYSLHGLEKVLAGIKSCVEHSALNLAYLKACMQDKPRVSAPDGDPGKKYGWL